MLLALEAGALVAGAAALAFVLAHATSVQLLYENWTFALFALLAGAALAARRERPVLAGILGALAVHLKAFVVFALAPLAAGSRRRVPGLDGARGRAAGRGLGRRGRRRAVAALRHAARPAAPSAA